MTTTFRKLSELFGGDAPNKTGMTAEQCFLTQVSSINVTGEGVKLGGERAGIVLSVAMIGGNRDDVFFAEPDLERAAAELRSLAKGTSPTSDWGRHMTSLASTLESARQHCAEEPAPAAVQS